MSAAPDTLAVIVFAHGSRDPLWRLPVEAVAAGINARRQAAGLGGVPARCAYLELCAPELAQAAADAVAEGATRVRILPLFFGMGKHAREDLPALVAALREQHPLVRFELQRAAGEDPRLIDLLARMALEDGT